MEDIVHLGKLLPRFSFELLVAIVCGGLIGLERRQRRKETGLRDNILICMGVVLYMIVARLVMMDGETKAVDPVRMAAHVATGIGFISAGIIIQQRGAQAGIAAAAKIWVVAAVGLIIGAGYPLLGLLITAITLLTLTILQWIERHLSEQSRTLLLRLFVREDNSELRENLQKVLASQKVHAHGLRAEPGAGGVKITIQAEETPSDVRKLITELWTVPGVMEVEH